MKTCIQYGQALTPKWIRYLGLGSEIGLDNDPNHVPTPTYVTLRH